MKHLALLFVALLTLGGSTYAAEENTTVRRGNIYDGSKYIFVEDGIEFSVFPDGEFDFYIPQYVDGVSLNVNAGPVGISFNTGFDYDPYVQYDEFGAVIQIENTPLYYDYYGRLTQAGNVNINYFNNRIVRVGGLRVFYNNAGFFSHYSGFINVYNRGYVFQPYHNFFYRPVFNRCLVYTTPYRQFYNPIRYDYGFHRANYYRGFNNGYANGRRDFRHPDRGRVAHNNGRRDNVDRNNARFNRATASRSYENLRERDTNSRGIAQNINSRNNSRDTARATTERPTTQRGIATNITRSARSERGIATSSSNRNTAPKVQRSSRSNSRATASRTTTTRNSVKNNSSRTASRVAQRPSQTRSAAVQKKSTRTTTQKASRNNNTTRKATAQRSSKSNNAGRTTSSSKRNSSSNTRRG